MKPLFVSLAALASRKLSALIADVRPVSSLVTGKTNVCAALGQTATSSGVRPGFLFGVWREAVEPVLNLCGITTQGVHDGEGLGFLIKKAGEYGTRVDDRPHISEPALTAAGKHLSENWGLTFGPIQVTDFLVRGRPGNLGTVETLYGDDSFIHPAQAGAVRTPLPQEEKAEWAIHLVLHPGFQPAARELRVDNQVVANPGDVGPEWVTNLELATALAVITFCTTNVGSCIHDAQKRLQVWVIEDGKVGPDMSLRRLSWDVLLRLWSKGSMGNELWQYKENVVLELASSLEDGFYDAASNEAELEFLRKNLPESLL